MKRGVLEHRGYKVIRFWNNEVNENIIGVYKKLQQEFGINVTFVWVSPDYPNFADLSAVKTSGGSFNATAMSLNHLFIIKTFAKSMSFWVVIFMFV